MSTSRLINISRAPLLLTAVVLLLWTFPRFWYRRAPENMDFAFFSEQANIPGWQFVPVPIGRSAEAVIAADRIFNGEFTDLRGRKVEVYSARRVCPKENEASFFAHTPDRCWTVSGWKHEFCSPETVKLDVAGVPMLFERRIFNYQARRVLVLFGALVGGKPPPYRLDQYLSRPADATLSGGRCFVFGVWRWAWQYFTERSPIGGPQQFIRVSTEIVPGAEFEGDQVLIDFLGRWLKPALAERSPQ